MRKTTNHEPKIDIFRPGLFLLTTEYVPELNMYQQIFLAKFPENMILPGEDEAFQITASILMTFCKGNLSVDDLFKLKSIHCQESATMKWHWTSRVFSTLLRSVFLLVLSPIWPWPFHMWRLVNYALIMYVVSSLSALASRCFLVSEWMNICNYLKTSSILHPDKIWKYSLNLFKTLLNVRSLKFQYANPEMKRQGQTRVRTTRKSLRKSVVFSIFIIRKVSLRISQSWAAISSYITF